MGGKREAEWQRQSSRLRAIELYYTAIVKDNVNLTAYSHRLERKERKKERLTKD